MKVINESGPAPIISGDIRTVDIGISDNHEDQLMILNVLSNTLYTDKVSAVLREYGCNAFDANVEADIGDKPITIRLPNRLDPTVSIRDYGFGMTEEQILQTFCKLGRSTKRSSNAYTGMLGIGSKAGFAYGDMFNVTSWAKGIKTLYACARLNGKPTLSKMHTEPSTAPDGVEIQVPVRQQDIFEFVEKAERVFRYFKVCPEFQGAKVDFERTKPEFQGVGWRYVGDSHSVAIMGNVGYDLNTSGMGDVALGYQKLISAGIELDFNIGDLEIAANREGLQYRDHTKKAIVAKLRRVAKEMGTTFTAKIAACTSEWEAKALWNDLLKDPPFVYGKPSQNGLLREILTGNVTWNGNPIQSARVSLRPAISNINNNPASQLQGVSIVMYHKHRSYSRVQKQIDPEFITASKELTLCINDLPKIRPSRVQGWFHHHSDAVRLVFFTFDSPKRQSEYWKKYLENAPSIVQSSIVPYVSPAGTGTSNGTPSAHRNKHTRKAFTLAETSARNYYADARSMWWDVTSADYQNGAGVYVLLDSFWIVGPKSTTRSEHPNDFRTRVAALRQAGLIDTPVYGFKQDKKPKLGPKWIPLADAIQTQLDGLTTQSFLQNLADYDAVGKYPTFVDRKWYKLFDKGTPVYELLAEVQRMFTPPHAAVHALLNNKKCNPWLISPKKLPPPTVELSKLEQKILLRYPILSVLGRATTANLGSSDMTRIANYVKLVEK